MTAPVTKIRRTRSMTVVTPSTNTVSGKTTAGLLTKPHTALNRLHVAPAQVTKPDDLARVLNQMQANTASATVGSNTNPMNAGGVIIKGLSWTAGVAKLVQHNLGREPVGYLVLNTALATVAAATVAHGMLYNQSGDGVNLPLPSQLTFFQLPWDHAGVSSGTTLTTGSSGHIQVTNAGTYRIEAVLNGFCNATGFVASAAIFINGSQALDLTSTSGLGNTTANSLFPLVIEGTRSLSASDTIDVRIENTNVAGATQYNVDSSTLSVFTIGGSSSTPTGGITLAQMGLPTGFDSSVALNLVPSATGTGDLMVF